ncbi:MAG: hypothetical protein L0Y76_10145 [Ignavibacteria bacterium]|nr:hypothetical protein [Ignavibacteria bacterium]
MKGNKFFYRSILFFLLSVSALSFAILGFENGFPYAVSFDNFKRSISTEPEITYAQDLSASYNERGYYKSNSAFGDGNEIINDFNGNLMYEIPIAKAKCDGDLYYNFNLNYNGNVNYNVITNDAGEYSYLFTLLNIYNIAAPGWIFSINGFAVQMLNFESKFATKPPFGTTAYGNNVRLQAVII